MPRINDALRGRGKAVMVAGAAAALVGVGTGAASAATAAPAHATAAVASQRGAEARASAGAGPSKFTLAKTGHDAATPVQHGRSDGKSAPRPARSTKPAAVSWNQVAMIQAKKADPGLRGGLPAADQLKPVGAVGAQESMPLSGSQYANAATIVKQALAKKMGVRSAVVAVATAMQESMLNNINYGTSDSLGLFQQRPSCGWGTPAQIMNPKHAADSFLAALAKYEASDPGWAHQPLYQTAQAVQASAFPTAYAKWENQAESVTKAVTMNLTR